MAFNYNGNSPTSIKYGTTELTVLKYGTTAVWGKPYSLSISAGANTTVTVNRTSSPNQHASTGNLSSGSVIYYGDVLTISYSVSSGYAISTHTVNGASFTSGQSFTVTGAISVVTTAGASASWKTVFSGNTSTSASSLTINGIRANVPTKVTGRLYYHDPDYVYDEGSTNFTSVELPYTVSNTGGKVVIAKPTTANKLSLTFTRYSFDHPFMGTMTYDVELYITKVEQYY